MSTVVSDMWTCRSAVILDRVKSGMCLQWGIHTKTHSQEGNSLTSFVWIYRGGFPYIIFMDIQRGGFPYIICMDKHTYSNTVSRRVEVLH